MERSCVRCGGSFEAQRSTAKYCSSSCRARASTHPAPAAPAPAVSTAVLDALAVELTGLGVAGTYEGVVALGIARQLDNGSVSGTAYTSLSKELDRRVADLRRRAPRAEDRTQAAQAAVADRRLRLA